MGQTQPRRSLYLIIRPRKIPSQTVGTGILDVPFLHLKMRKAMGQTQPRRSLYLIIRTPQKIPPQTVGDDGPFLRCFRQIAQKFC